jgi:hypothetical protein
VKTASGTESAKIDESKETNSPEQGSKEDRCPRLTDTGEDLVKDSERSLIF